VAGWPRRFEEATPAANQPADPTDPGDAADLSTPQGIPVRQNASIRARRQAFRLSGLPRHRQMQTRPAKAGLQADPKIAMR